MLSLLLLLLLQGSMCLRPDCGLCSITMHGFKLEDNVGTSAARNNRPRWLTYGRVIYFSSVSGKANDFSVLTAKVDMTLRQYYTAVFGRIMLFLPPVHPPNILSPLEQFYLPGFSTLPSTELRPKERFPKIYTVSPHGLLSHRSCCAAPERAASAQGGEQLASHTADRQASSCVLRETLGAHMRRAFLLSIAGALRDHRHTPQPVRTLELARLW